MGNKLWVVASLFGAAAFLSLAYALHCKHAAGVAVMLGLGIFHGGFFFVWLLEYFLAELRKIHA